jgi:hypothetical protein
LVISNVIKAVQSFLLGVLFVVLPEKDLIEKNEELPDPSVFLGDLLPQPPPVEFPPVSIGVPDPEDDEDEEAPPKYLREAKGYMDLLFHFTKVVVMAATFIANSNTKLLSKYMSPNLEAFLVLTYVNNYDAWKAELYGEPLPNQDSTSEEEDKDEQDQEHENNQQLAGSKRYRDGNSRLVSPLNTHQAKKKFTADARGRGKFKGWTDEGMALYKQLTRIVKQQRADKKLGQDFEELLLEEFLTKNKKSRAASNENSGGPEVDEDDDWLDDMVTSMKSRGRIPIKNTSQIAGEVEAENGKE